MEQRKEYIKVPHWFAKVYETRREYNLGMDDWIEETMEKLARDELTEDNDWYEEIVSYYKNNYFCHLSVTAYEMEKYGYKVEKYFVVPIEGFISSNGQQYLTMDKEREGEYFACAKNTYLRQIFSEEELKEVPELYRQMAVEANSDNYI